MFGCPIFPYDGKPLFSRLNEIYSIIRPQIIKFSIILLWFVPVSTSMKAVLFLVRVNRRKSNAITAHKRRKRITSFRHFRYVYKFNGL